MMFSKEKVPAATCSGVTRLGDPQTRLFEKGVSQERNKNKRILCIKVSGGKYVVTFMQVFKKSSPVKPRAGVLYMAPIFKIAPIF